MAVKAERDARNRTAERHPGMHPAGAEVAGRPTRAGTVAQRVADGRAPLRPSVSADGAATSAKTERATQNKTAGRRRAGNGRFSLRPAGSAGQANPATRRMVVYGIAVYAAARLPFDRRFQTNAIMLAIALVLAKGLLKGAAKDTVIGVERYYLHVPEVAPAWDAVDSAAARR